MNTIEPPVLMSRILTFVFAAALATVVVLVVTVANLFPLSKTQIFILTTSPRENTEVTIQSFTPRDANIEEFKENFIKEYIRVRNEVIPNVTVMRRRWWNREGGMVSIWSAPDVYAAFTRTRMVDMIMSNIPDVSLECRVEFTDYPIRLLQRDPDGAGKYEASFRYFCSNNALQTDKKDYTIIIAVRFDKAIRWDGRLENPLGILVSEYTVETGGDDPLNFTR